MSRASPSRPDRRAIPAFPALVGDRRSVAALEFAFAAPVLLTIVFGLINVGDLAWTYNALDAAVSASARYASVTEANALLAAGASSAPSCVATSDVQQQFDAKASPPIAAAAAPKVKLVWGGNLMTWRGTPITCSGTTALQLGGTSLPGGWVGVSAQYRWTPIAPFGLGITLGATSVLPVMSGIQA